MSCPSPEGPRSIPRPASKGGPAGALGARSDLAELRCDAAAWQAAPSQVRDVKSWRGYKDRLRAGSLLFHTIQALSLPALRDGWIVPSMPGVTVQTRQTKVQAGAHHHTQCFYVVEVKGSLTLPMRKRRGFSGDVCPNGLR